MRQIAVVALLGALVAGCVAMPQFEAAQAEIAALKAQVAAGTLTPEGFEVAIKRIETALPSPTEMLAVGGLGGVGGRTLLHAGSIGARFLPPPFGAVVGGLLSMLLGGSAGRKKDTMAVEAPKA